MTATAFSNLDRVDSLHRDGGEDRADLVTVSAVIEAGMRARAVADACAGLGLAALLMDSAGRVLHAGSMAISLFGDCLRLESGHLVGSDAESNAAISDILNGVLGSSSSAAAPQTIVTVQGDKPLAMTAVRFADSSPVQLLKAIVLLGENERVLLNRLQALDL